MKQPKDGDRLIFSKKVETFGPIESDSRWKSVDGRTGTMVYGRGTPKPSPTVEEMAEMDVAQYYPYLPKSTEEYNRRKKEFLAKY